MSEQWYQNSIKISTDGWLIKSFVISDSQNVKLQNQLRTILKKCLDQAKVCRVPFVVLAQGVKVKVTVLEIMFYFTYLIYAVFLFVLSFPWF